ncbi:hypothetical protein PF003_g2201 [Phytophthora fragariae]|nr:hypothetical protein PF003_g2201 [Phytophthora fragariae]
MLGIHVGSQLELLTLPCRDDGDDHEEVPDVAEDDNDEVAIRLAVELMIEEAM